MDSLVRDIRYALRVFRANPVLVAVAVVSLAIGIGPNTVLFSLIDAFGFRPLPIRDPAGLVSIRSSFERRHGELSYPEFADVAAAARTLADVCASGPAAFGISGDGVPPDVVMGATTSASYFRVMGVRAIRGRTFLDDENRTPGTHPVALISERLWERRFDSDPQIVGRATRLNTLSYTIVGVLPREFAGTQPILAPDVWVPVMMLPAMAGGGRGSALVDRNRRDFSVFARLKPDATLIQAQAELASLGTRLAEEHGATSAGRTIVADLEQEARRRALQLPALLSMVVVGLILLLACANVAGLLLGRAESRRREIAVRLVLGAGRRRLVRQLLTESLLISLMGAAAGLLLAFWSLRLVPLLIPAMPITFNFDFRLDARVLLATLVASVLAAPLFGMLPALAASRPDVVPLLNGAPGGRLRTRLRALAPRRLLVVGQIAVSLALLVSSGLLVRSFVNMRQIDPGFIARPMLFTTMAPAAAGYDSTKSREFYRQVLERLSSTPGFEKATMAAHLPLNSLFGGGAMQKVTIPGRPLPDRDADALRVRYNAVERRYFDTMGVRLLQGRTFTEADDASAPGVVVINRTMARQFWPVEDPIGRHIRIASAVGPTVERDCEVVGVVQDGKYLSLNEAPQPYLYVPWTQHSRGEMTVIARVRGDARAMVGEFRRQIWSVDAAMPIMQVTTTEQHLQASLVVERAVAAFVGVLGLLGLVLSSVGLFGVISYQVTRQTREIGIRIAIGARPVDVIRAVVLQGGRLSFAGAVIGLALAAAAMRLLGGGLYGVTWWDPATYLGMGGVVCAVGVAGSYLPARRAARTDPIVSLRTE